MYFIVFVFNLDQRLPLLEARFQLRHFPREFAVLFQQRSVRLAASRLGRESIFQGLLLLPAPAVEVGGVEAFPAQQSGSS